MRSDDVGGEEVGCELNSPEPRGHGLCQSIDGEGFGQSGEAFHEKVISGEEADQHAVDEVALANENPGNFLSQRGDEGGAGSDFSGKFFLCHEWEFVDYDEVGKKIAR